MNLYGFYYARLKLLRIDAGLKQSQVAGMLKVDQQTIINHEKGRFPPDLKTIESYAKIYGVEISVFYIAQGKADEK